MIPRLAGTDEEPLDDAASRSAGCVAAALAV